MPPPPSSTVTRQLELLERLIGEQPDGVDRETLQLRADGLGQPLTKRTILRRLEKLVDAGRITTIGEGRATRYRLVTADEPKGPDPEDEQDAAITVSADGAELRRLVRRRLSAREPVGYDASLLERYTPGTTWYLPESLRLHLAKMGETPVADHPAGTYARDILGRLLIDLAWASSALEGNTYSRLDTQNLIEFGQRAAGKDATEALMILNHKEAIELLVEGAEQVDVNRMTIQALHAALSENLLPDPGNEGRLRTTAVSISASTYTPTAIPQKIEERFDRLCVLAHAIPDAFEQAFFLMVHIPYLQPFVDVNKRTSRLAANIPFIKRNKVPLSFIDVPETAYVEGLLAVYEQRRVELLRDVFAWAYERSCKQYLVVRQSIGEPDPLRLQYRLELVEVIRDVIVTRRAPQRETLAALGAAQGVASDDLPMFVEMALQLLLGLQDYSAARYRVTPSEFRAWRAQFRVSGTKGGEISSASRG